VSEIEITPATIVDMADMAEAVMASRAQWGVIRDVWQAGQSWSLWRDDRLIGVAGLKPIGPKADPDFIGPPDPYLQAVAWFHFCPGASRSMLAIVRAIRLTMDASPYRAIVTLCTSDAGKRIARATGFAFAEHSEFGEVWAYGRSSGYTDGRSCTAEPTAKRDPASKPAV
jgi:hypothetical protein